MHTDQSYSPGKPMWAPHTDKIGYYTNSYELESSVLNKFVPPNIKHPIPFQNIDIKPSNSCPRNFIIFDQTNNRSQIMFHPNLSTKLFSPTYDLNQSLLKDNVVQDDPNSEDEKEDYDDIDLLMSSEYEEHDELEDDEVSTARTSAYHECGSPDSCSNYEPSPKKRREPFGITRIEKKKHKRIRKMVKALREMVPGTNWMNTLSVLDESVRYLKSLRVEVQKLGIENFHD